MSKEIKIDTYVHVNVNYIDSMHTRPELAFHHFSADMSQNPYFKGEYVFIEKKTITVTVPETHEIAGQIAENLELALSEMRAKHHREQQEMIDKIAGYRMLGAPKQGEVLQDSDLRAPAAPSKFHDADQAEEVKSDDFDLPF